MLPLAGPIAESVEERDHVSAVTLDCNSRLNECRKHAKVKEGSAGSGTDVKEGSMNERPIV